MKVAKWISLLILGLTSQVFAAQDGTYSNYKIQRSTTTIKTERKRNPLKGLSVVIPSVVVHGVQPGAEASLSMPRKLDGSGNTVVTPGFGLEYVADNGFMVLGAVVKDCYDNLAGTLQVGEAFAISDRTSWGVSFGIYARQSPIACSTSSDGRTSTTNCYNIDGYRLKFDSSINGYPIDIIPMPFLHFTTALYKSKDLRIDFKVMGNVVLNEFGIAVPF